jgi:hypothetical protein
LSRIFNDASLFAFVREKPIIMAGSPTQKPQDIIYTFDFPILKPVTPIFEEIPEASKKISRLRARAISPSEKQPLL